MMSEKVELLGKGLYEDIPDQLTLKSFPTVTELDYVGSEDFEETMLNDIFPKSIDEQVNFHKLLEIDFQWICRCFRFLNYGPYFTTNTFICDNCGIVKVEGQVDLRTVGCKPLPADFVNDVVIKKDEFLDYKKDIHIHLLTIQEALNCRQDKMFKKPNGEMNTEYARICYSIHTIGADKQVTPVTAKLEIEKNMSNADFKILKAKVVELTDYGLRGGGKCECPECHSKNAGFLALADDRFFRPTVGDLRKGRDDRGVWRIEDAARNTTEAI